MRFRIRDPVKSRYLKGNSADVTIVVEDLKKLRHTLKKEEDLIRLASPVKTGTKILDSRQQSIN